MGEEKQCPRGKKSTVAYRFGYVLYWASLVCIVLWCAYNFWELADKGLPRTGGAVTTFDAIFLFGAFVIPSLLIYGLGRLIRWVFSVE